MNSLSNLIKDLKASANPKRAAVSQRFFKTGPGEYGEGDVFWGLSVPEQRKIAKQYRDLPLSDVKKLLQSPVHEQRLTASIILVDQFKKADETTRKDIYDFYLAHTEFINNWDIIDGSAEYIVGEYLRDKDRSVLAKLAKSKSVWERRIAMLSTFCYIKQGESKDTFAVAKILLHDQHDLIQKAVGWMVREVGNHDLKAEEAFLKEKDRYKTMPRTMLRYAIEKFPETKRKDYLKGLM